MGGNGASGWCELFLNLRLVLSVPYCQSLYLALRLYFSLSFSQRSSPNVGLALCYLGVVLFSRDDPSR